MGRQWAIAIGINNYSAFQSLNYAQNDVEAFCRELLSSGRVTPANCLLLTTASALHLGQSTFPLRTTVLQWFQWLVDEALQADDELWVFFSGYGIHADGNDYLMPVDGDPKQAVETGIELRSLYQLLKESVCDRILMLLDMNHNEGTLATPVGIQTAKLAKEFGIATVQSCEPQKDQFSRKAAGIRHGFFTAAMLDALQGNKLTTLASLNVLLTQRMEELSDHYWRPIQTPLTVGEFQFQPAPANANAPLGSAGTGAAGGTGTTTSNPEATAVTPLDINYVPSGGEGLGQDFGETWNWQDSGVPIPSGTTSGGSAENGGAGITMPTNGNNPAVLVPAPTKDGSDAEASDPMEESGEDPYAVAWQEEQGLGHPANSGTDIEPVNAKAANGEAHTNDEAYANDKNYQEGKAGASSWHWADLVVAPEQPGTIGIGLYPEPGPDGQVGQATGEVDQAPLAFPEGDPTVTTMPPNWSSPEVEAELIHEPESGIVPTDTLQNGASQNWNQGAGQTIGPNPGYGFNHEANIIDVELAGGSELNDDDDGGLPIIELDPLEPEDEAPAAPIDTQAKGKLPWWLNLKLLGAAGLVLLTSLGLLGLFNRSQEGDPAAGNAGSGSSGTNAPVETSSQQGASEDEAGAGHASGQAQGQAQPFSAGQSTGQNGRQGLAGSAIAAPEQNAPEASSPELSSPEASNPATASPQAVNAEAVSSEAASAERSSAENDRSDADPLNANEANAQDSRQSEASESPGEQRLASAKSIIRTGQASSYNQAMTIARQIPSSDPSYQKARAQMDLWSSSMMDLAQERAGNGDYLGAIAAARLVPSDLQAYGEAQESIAQWQAPSQLQHAKALLRPGSASSYNQAIAVARGIPAGIEVSEDASRLRQAWSQEILNIAQGRAQKGQWGLAIAAAKLVPPDMGNYPEAQQAMAQWQERLN